MSDQEKQQNAQEEEKEKAAAEEREDTPDVEGHLRRSVSEEPNRAQQSQLRR